MKLKTLYQIIVREGMKADLRHPSSIRKYFQSKKKEYDRLRSQQKKFFDKDSLQNPYADTRLLYGDPEREIKRILVGIDIDVSEILLAERLSQMGKKIDLVFAHHPEGLAWAGLDEVMQLQTDILHQLGIDYAVAKDLMAKRIGEVSRRLHGANHMKTVDAARLLDIPFLCSHTASDNQVARFLQKKMDSTQPKTIKQVMDILWRQPEYRQASSVKAGPKILVGKETDKAGKIFVDMTGGTEGSHEIYARLSQLGVKTIIGMHMSEGHYNKVKNEHINVVLAGHMASDNLGMNLILDKLMKRGSLDIVECSGFRRFKR